MVMGKAEVEDILAAIKERVEQTRSWVRESLKGAQYGHSRGDDELFLDIFSKRALADPDWVLMLALDDGENGRDWLNRWRKLTGIDVLGTLIEQMAMEEMLRLRPPGEAALVMAKSVATEKEKAK